jgi:hypothetical protein
MRAPRRLEIGHKFARLKVADILKLKRASIKQSPLPEGAPSWEELIEMVWEDVEAGADANQPGLKVVRKLLSDRRFDR